MNKGWLELESDPGKWQKFWPRRMPDCCVLPECRGPIHDELDRHSHGTGTIEHGFADLLEGDS